jgi:membrane protein implicated in regulation of membrane protease activity
MRSKIIKSILGILLLTISPFFILAIAAILYVLLKMIGGASFLAGVQSFINFIYSLVPLFPYLTTIPIIAVAIILIFKKDKKSRSILQKR